MDQLLTSDQLLEFILSSYALEENIVHAIDEEGLVHLLLTPRDVFKYWGTNTVRVQSMERYNRMIFEKGHELAKCYGHTGPVTCHAYHAPVGARSFPVHTDPDGVVVYVLEGTKRMEVAGQMHDLTPGQSIHMEANVPHRAVNTYSSLMLSFGLEKFMIEKAF